MDPRHSYHGNLYFTRYNNDGCGIYIQGKNDTDYYPQSIIKYQID